MRPMASRYSARSAGGSTAISASICAEMTTTPAPSSFARASTRREKSLPVGGRGLLDIADIEHRLRGQEAEAGESPLLLRLDLDEPRRLAVAQQDERAVDEVERVLRLLVAALRLLLQRVDAPLQAVEIGEHQLGLDRLDVGDRIDAALHMGDVAVLEAAHHMGDGVDLADVGEELVAEPLALRGAAHQAGDVDEGEPRRHDLHGLGELRQRVEPRIGHRHLADIGLDGAERIVRRLRRRRRGQRVEERRLADIRQADDAAFETHGRCSDYPKRRAVGGSGTGPAMTSG